MLTRELSSSKNYPMAGKYRFHLIHPNKINHYKNHFLNPINLPVNLELKVYILPNHG
jgi:hypothetical protein